MTINMRTFRLSSLAIAIVIVATMFLFAMRPSGKENPAHGNASMPTAQQGQRTGVVDKFSKNITNTGTQHTQTQKNITPMHKKLMLERYGALGSVVFHVKNDNNEPIPNARVSLYFTQPDENDPKGRVDGETNSKGQFAATRKTNSECIWKVSKDGYHTSSGSIKFSPYFSELSPATGKWTEKPIEVEVQLKTKSAAQLIHGDRIWHDFIIPTNTWVGFDFVKCDSIAPFGRGQTAHIEFKSRTWGLPPFAKGGTYGFTNALEIQIIGGSLEILEKYKYSSSLFIATAPTIFKDEKLAFTYACTRDAVLQDRTLGNGCYIVFKTANSNPCEDAPDCYFGLLRRLEFFSDRIRFEYFFNHKSGDRRIDGDVNSQSLHGK